jgi:hypothetical protein
MSLAADMRDFVSSYKSVRETEEERDRAAYYRAGADKREGTTTGDGPNASAYSDSPSDPAFNDTSGDSDNKKHGLLYNFGQWLNPHTAAPTAPAGAPVVSASPTAVPLNASSVAAGVNGVSTASPVMDSGNDAPDGFSRGGMVHGYATGGYVVDPRDNDGKPPVPQGPAPTYDNTAAPPEAVTVTGYRPPANDGGPPVPQGPATAVPVAAAPAAPAAPPSAVAAADNPATDGATPAPAASPAATPDAAAAADNPDTDGAAPQLADALHGGIMALQNKTGINPNNQGVPDQQSTQQGGAALMAGAGRASQSDVVALFKAVDPAGKLNHAQAMVRAMTAQYEFYLNKGEIEKADNIAAGLIQYSVFEAAKHGDDAQYALKQGNLKAAAISVATGISNLPTGKDVTNVRVNPNNTVTSDQVDVQSGKVVAEHTVTPQQLFQVALGLSNKTASWDAIMQSAAGAKGANLPQSQAYTDAQTKLSGANPDGTVTQPGNTTPIGAPYSSTTSKVVPAGFDNFYGNFLKGHEGGYTAADGNGHPANFGINQGSNPDVDVKGLTPDKAKEILYNRYWVPSGAANLPPALAAVQADTAVNMGVAEAKQLLAQSGGDPQKYLQLRAQRYQQIAANDPSKAQNLPDWLQRNKDLGSYIAGQQTQGQPPGAPTNPSMAPGAQKPMYMAGPKPDGLVEPGNIDLASRPVVKNSDGSVSTVRSITIMDNGKAVLIPTVVGGKVVSNQDAINAYRQTGQKLGVFKTEDQANTYAENLHEQQASMYAGGPKNAPVGDMTLRPPLPEDAPPAPAALPTKPSTPTQVKLGDFDTASMSGPERVALTKQITATNLANQKKFGDDMQLYRTAVAAAKPAAKGKDPLALPVKDRGDAMGEMEKAKAALPVDPNTKQSVLNNFLPATQSMLDDAAYGFYTHNDTTPQRAYQATMSMLNPRSTNFTPYEMPDGNVKVVFRTGDKMVLPKNTFDQIAAARGNEHYAMRTGAAAAAAKTAQNAQLLAKGKKAVTAAGNIASSTIAPAAPALAAINNASAGVGDAVAGGLKKVFGGPATPASAPIYVPTT